MIPRLRVYRLPPTPAGLRPLGLAPALASVYHSVDECNLGPHSVEQLLVPQAILGYTYDYTFPVGFKGI